MKEENPHRNELEEIAEAFLEPSFYPHDVRSIDRRETHISLVFLTGEWVYKIKKPMDFGFLNYTTLDLRKHYCHREVELNKRLSDNIYDRVVAICRDEKGGSLFLGDCDSPIEYAVKMRQLPDETCFRFLLEKGAVTPEHIKAVAERLADFYKSNVILNPLLALYGGVEYIRFNTYENFAQLKPFAHELGGRDFLYRMKHDTYKFTVLFRKLFKERLENGFVKDGHGDLRVDHIYFYNGVQIIDCIEFNNRFRYGDVAVDLAFLFMDLIRLGYEDWAYRVIEEYTRVSGDLQLWFLLDFYTAYRAIVRAKVACLETFSHPGDTEKNRKCFGEANKFMNFGKVYTLSFSIPTAWIFMGPPGSGKSKLGQGIAKTGHMEYLSSDQLRRRLFPEATRSPFGHGAYTVEAREAVYRELLKEASEILKTGRSVVIDATFASSKWRKAFLELLSGLGVHIVFVETTANREVLAGRLVDREHSGNTGESDARIEHLDRFLATYEPPDEVDESMKIRLDTGVINEFESLLTVLSRGMNKRTVQARKYLEKEGYR